MRFIRQLTLASLVLMLYLLPLSPQTIVTAIEDQDPLTYEVELKGESLNFDCYQIESSDIVCQTIFRPLCDGYIDVVAKFIEAGVVCASVESLRIPVIHEMTDIPGKRRTVAMDISDYNQGLFISIRLLSNGSASVYLAVDIDNTQYSVVGLAENLPTFEAKEIRLGELTDAQIISELEEEMAPSTDALIWSAPGVSHAKNGLRTGFTPAGPPSTPRIYCVVHEVFFDDDNDNPEQVGSWCVSYSWVQYKVYRESVSESQIKSDLRYYNKKHYYRDGWYKIMGAYEIDTHGLDNDEPDRPLKTYDDGWLYPSEVEALWGDLPYDYYARPDSAIILASACQSLWNTGESTGSEMGDAFMDYGAQAYVGSTNDTPIVMDPWTEAFWWSLTNQNESLNKALEDANNEMNWSSNEMRLHPDTNGNGKMPN